MTLVSCIMPTSNRRLFVGRAIEYFLRQDYDERELLVLDDGSDRVADLIPDDPRVRYMRLAQRMPLGTKRNLAVEASHGALIAHWDDDDWIGPGRLSAQVAALERAGALLCGSTSLRYYRPLSAEAWTYTRLRDDPAWLAGGTLLYRREAWARRPFAAIDIGEDAAFVRACAHEPMVSVPCEAWYVAILHGGNAAPKRLSPPRWERIPVSELACVLASDRGFYAALRGGRGPTHVSRRHAHHAVRTPTTARSAQAAAVEPPLVSCIMPTANRPGFAARALAYFRRQDYPARELVIVDDGDQPVAELVAGDPRVCYLRLVKPMSIGAKRNLACEAARGAIILCWDDDDWYADDRISRQVAPLLAGRADVTGLGQGLLLCMVERQFWACSSELHDRMFAGGIVSGTLAFWRDLWLRGARFPDSSLAEDAELQRALVRGGARLEKIDNQGTFIYVRHGRNSWHFQPGEHLDRAAWRPIAPPPFLPIEDLRFYGLAPS